MKAEGLIEVQTACTDTRRQTLSQPPPNPAPGAGSRTRIRARRTHRRPWATWSRLQGKAAAGVRGHGGGAGSLEVFV